MNKIVTRKPAWVTLIMPTLLAMLMLCTPCSAQVSADTEDSAAEYAEDFNGGNCFHVTEYIMIDGKMVASEYEITLPDVICTGTNKSSKSSSTTSTGSSIDISWTSNLLSSTGNTYPTTSTIPKGGGGASSSSSISNNNDPNEVDDSSLMVDVIYDILVALEPSDDPEGKNQDDTSETNGNYGGTNNGTFDCPDNSSDSIPDKRNYTVDDYIKILDGLGYKKLSELLKIYSNRMVDKVSLKGGCQYDNETKMLYLPAEGCPRAFSLSSLIHELIHLEQDNYNCAILIYKANVEYGAYTVNHLLGNVSGLYVRGEYDYPMNEDVVSYLVNNGTLSDDALKVFTDCIESFKQDCGKDANGTFWYNQDLLDALKKWESFVPGFVPWSQDTQKYVYKDAKTAEEQGAVYNYNWENILNELGFKKK